jgi:hypothetical protein
MCPFVRHAEKNNEARFEDQSGILAQKKIVVEKTSAGIFPRTPIQNQAQPRVKCPVSNCREHGAIPTRGKR